MNGRAYGEPPLKNIPWTIPAKSQTRKKTSAVAIVKHVRLQSYQKASLCRQSINSRHPIETTSAIK
ncbi:MAG: hypothetical protein WBB94_01005 [Candidatus Saccharimonadaceae bacterium]